ncbi:hypothetical protein BT93_D0367 [Corymbia citriodora subsp. variegata]|nr:hypothetical protein BT93_D0367 [Corymbia citriodora subsp. variegata]
MLLYSQSFTPRFWFQASRGRAPVDADGRNGKKTEPFSPSRSCEHRVIAVQSMSRLKLHLLQRETIWQALHWWSTDRSKARETDLLTGFAFDSTFRPEMKVCELMPMSKMLDGCILRFLIRLSCD